MAHIHDLAPQVAGDYSQGRRVNDQAKFPKTDVFAGFNAPCRLEGDVYDLEVDGKIPAEIDGTFYRIQPDHRFPPVFEDDIHFNGDGAVTAIRIQDGHAHFKHRYVQTDRYHHETAAGKALFGRYRNVYTDDEAVKGVIRTAANTNVIFWRGTLLAMKEDGPPFAMDPMTLETIGRYDFEGQVKSPTFTAHPKFDPITGDMICFGYEAGGDGNDASCDVVVYTIDKDGKKTEECWYKSPFCGMIHDCGITENYVILPLTPLKCSLDRLKQGGNHWAWDPNEDQWYGVVPRRDGKPEDIKWFRSDNAFHGHVASAYENEEGSIVFDLGVTYGNVFFFFPPEDIPAGTPLKENKVETTTQRWILDPKAANGSRVKPAKVWKTSGEFSRVDDRYVTKHYNHFWQIRIDGSREYDFEACGPPAGGLFNCLGHYNWSDGTEDVWWAGPRATIQEPAFIPLSYDAGEGEGWLIALVNRLDVLRNDIVIFDARKISAGPVATLHLPFKLKIGLHGNWVDEAERKEWEALRSKTGEIGPVNPATEPLPWQVDSRKHGQGAASEQRDATQTNTDFEVFGLMRTTSRTSREIIPDRRRSEIDDHIAAIPEKDHEDENTSKRSSLTGLGLRSKIKQKVANTRFSKSDKDEKNHQKHDSATVDAESENFEVLGLMRSKTRTGEDASPVEEKKPTLERHISSIPQNDGPAEAQESGYTLPPRLKRHISSIPTHDFDSEGEEAMDDEPKPPAKIEKHDSGTASSDFEAVGLMRITSNDSGKKSRSPMKKPGLERHVSRIPVDDEEVDEDSMLKSTRLVKAISEIPGHDWDSEGEDLVGK